ncbi:MAG: hypothetical protein II800_03050 [Lachnospiraceae bacterium]|jgi:hypothetical protein|nr:hypothetical protein [Lachnospiraceae bacterium]
MDPQVQEKVQKIFRGELKYTSTNLAFNMLITKSRKKVMADPGSMDTCLKELEEFLAKYPIVAKVDLANIAML